ncbi:MAG: hypothetical protein ACXV44_06395 [Halobacteriota archaeon]
MTEEAIPTCTLCKAAQRALNEAERAKQAAERHLRRERERAEYSLQLITDPKVYDLHAVHKAKESVRWWKCVAATAQKILDEHERRHAACTR